MTIPDAGADSAPAAPSIPRVLAAVIPPLFIGMMDQTIVATALPDIAREMDSFASIGLAITAYLAAVAISAPVYGRLGDALGRRMLISLSLVVTIVGSLLCAVAPSFPLLIAARALQGLGGGGLISLAQALLGQYIEPRRRALYQGHLAGIAIVASAFGPVAGGLITSQFGWRWIFILNVPLSLVALLMVNRLPPRRTPRRPLVFDWVGLGLFAALTVLLLSTFESITANGRPFLLAAGSLLALVLLIWCERRVAQPLFPRDLLANRSISLSALLAMCHGALYVALLTFIPLYFALARGRSAEEIGLLMLPITLGIGSGAFVTGRLMGRTGKTMIYSTRGLLMAGVLLFGMSLTLHSMPDLGISLIFMLISACLGSIMGAVQITVQTEAGVPKLGIASSSILLARSFGAVSGTALASVAIGTGLATGAADADSAFSQIFLGGAIFAWCASLIAAAVPRRHI